MEQRLKEAAVVSSAVKLRYIEMSGSETVSSVVDLNKVAINNTVLDPEFQKNGGIIDFKDNRVYDNWNRIIKGLTVPPIPVTYEMTGNSIGVLHPVANKANQVLHILFLMSKGERTIKHLQNAVHSYNLQLCLTLFGKNGVFNRNILGPRLKNSFRAVAIPGMYNKDIFNESYEWVGIPKVICNKLKIQEGDKVIIGRDPTIWMGSIEVLFAYPVEHNSIEIHPLILPQFGGDHDGDQFWGFYPDQDLAAKYTVAGFTTRHSVWAKNFNRGCTSNIPAWGLGTFGDDQSKRVYTTGLSVSPQDILNQDRTLQEVIQYCSTGKRVRGSIKDIRELISISEQLPVKEWLTQCEMINMAQLAMKIYMGPVGLLSLRLLVVGHMDPTIEESAHILAERCAQGLLDAKHLTYSEVKDFKPSDIFKILNLSYPQLDDPDKLYNAINNIVPCDDRVIPILEYILKDGRGLQKMSQESFPYFEGITSTAEMDSTGYFPEHLLHDNVAKPEGIFTMAFDIGLGVNKVQ